MRVLCLSMMFIFTFITLRSIGQKRIYVSYFGNMTSLELCGSKKTCKPTNAKNWAYVTGEKFYNGNPASALGRAFESTIHESSPCVTKLPTFADLDSFNIHDLTGKVEETKKRQLELEIVANLTRLLNEQINLPDSIKADLAAQIDNTVKTETSHEIELRYKVYELKQEYVDEQILSCIKNLSDGQKVSVGISVVTVRGSWTSNTLKEIFRKFEANASVFQNLSAELKASYESSKNRVLEGTFQPFSLIVSDAYRTKKKA
jgi:hypothetical protein